MSLLHSLLQHKSHCDPPQQEPLALVCKRRRSEPPLRESLDCGSPRSQLRISTGSCDTTTSISATVTSTSNDASLQNGGRQAARHSTLARMLSQTQPSDNTTTTKQQASQLAQAHHTGLLSMLTTTDGTGKDGREGSQRNSDVAGIGHCAKSDIEAVKQSRVRLTAPKLSRHNDAAYYPNIQCVLCGEWVCSRNRYMHIESHLQYRPYSCSACGYDNRKEIFIQLHVNKAHGRGEASVKYEPDAELEHRAWQLAEQCVRHTRAILDVDGAKPDKTDDIKTAPQNVSQSDGPCSSQLEDVCRTLAPYAQSFRPKIYNTQRIEKSHAIEESRQMGVLPDLKEVASRERCCKICKMHVGRQPCLLEEHARAHLSRPSYRCEITPSCSVSHNSAKFLARHMKEVHKFRRPPKDLLLDDEQLRAEFARDDLARKRATVFRGAVGNGTVPKQVINNEDRINNNVIQTALVKGEEKGDIAFDSMGFDQTQLMLLAATISHASARPSSAMNGANGVNSKPHGRQCLLCSAHLNDDYATLYDHIKGHLPTAMYECRLCGSQARCRSAITRHAASAHGRLSTPSSNNSQSPSPYLVSLVTPAVAQQCNLLMVACFPDVPLRTQLHDRVQDE